MNVRLSYSTEFTAGFYMDGRVTMTRYYLKLWMLTLTGDGRQQNVAFDRIRFFIDSQLANTVFISDELTDAAQKLSECGLSVTTLPNIPIEQIIGIIIHTKLNAICEGRISVIDTEISSDAGEHVWFLHGDDELDPFEHVPGWWSRPDLSHGDPDLTASHDRRVLNLSRVRGWRDAGLLWEEEPTVLEMGSNTVVFGDFTGDKSDN